MSKFIMRLLFSMVVMVLTVLVLVLSVSIYGYYNIRKERAKLKNGLHEAYDYDEVLGYKLLPGTEIKKLYPGNRDSTTTSSNAFGRRSTPGNERAEQHMLFFGCSYTYGLGCNDDATMPYQMSQLDTLHHIYNFALNGYGTQHMLDILKSDLRNEVTEPGGIALYMYIEHHWNRAKLDPYTMKWGYDFNSYVLDEQGELISTGSFFNKAGLSTSFCKGLGTIKLTRPLISLIQPLYHPDLKKGKPKNYDLTTAIIAAAKAQYLEQFPGGRFITVIYPGEQTDLARHLTKQDIEVIDLSSSLDLKAIEGLQRDGFHPNKKGNAAVAWALYQYLYPSSADH